MDELPSAVFDLSRSHDIEPQIQSQAHVWLSEISTTRQEHKGLFELVVGQARLLATLPYHQMNASLLVPVGEAPDIVSVTVVVQLDD